MSIPERLWRVMRGQWALAQDRIAELEAQASAYEEIAEALRRAPAAQVEAPTEGPRVLPAPAAPTRGGHDPLAACYELLKVEPGADLVGVDRAYEACLAELRPDDHPAGSPDRAALEARRKAVIAAYEKLRDALNPTETRFEHIEF